VLHSIERVVGVKPQHEPGVYMHMVSEPVRLDVDQSEEGDESEDGDEWETDECEGSDEYDGDGGE
jgi:hypothetical protein